jgi:hypothetical protein
MTDTTLPTVNLNLASPNNGAISVAPSTNIQLNFSEIVQRGIGDIQIRKAIRDNAENVSRAYSSLMANKPFIIAEIIGYMNALKHPLSTKIITTPPGLTSIVLMANVANITDRVITVTFAHYRNFPVSADPATVNGVQESDTITELVSDFEVMPNDSASLILGKLIIESFDSILAYASESNGLHVTLSILETANA